MKTVKLIAYFYLAFCLLFIYLGVDQILKGENFWLSFVIAAVALFMFFFRMKYAKKMEEHQNNKHK